MTKQDVTRSQTGTTDEAFWELCSLWERGAPVDADLDLIHCQGLAHAQEHQ